MDSNVIDGELFLILEQRKQMRQKLGAASKNYIDDDLIDMILRMTNKNCNQATLMCLGYILQKITLMVQSDSAKLVMHSVLQDQQHFQELLRLHE